MRISQQNGQTCRMMGYRMLYVPPNVTLFTVNTLNNKHSLWKQERGEVFFWNGWLFLLDQSEGCQPLSRFHIHPRTLPWLFCQQRCSNCSCPTAEMGTAARRLPRFLLKPVQSMSLFPRAWLKLHTASSRRVSGITCRHTEVILKKNSRPPTASVLVLTSAADWKTVIF